MLGIAGIIRPLGWSLDCCPVANNTVSSAGVVVVSGPTVGNTDVPMDNG